MGLLMTSSTFFLISEVPLWIDGVNVGRFANGSAFFLADVVSTLIFSVLALNIGPAVLTIDTVVKRAFSSSLVEAEVAMVVGVVGVVVVVVEVVVVVVEV